MRGWTWANNVRSHLEQHCSDEIPPPRVMCPDLGYPAWNRHGPVGVKMIRGLNRLSCENKLWELGIFCPKKRLQGDLILLFQHLKGTYRSWEGFVASVSSERTRRHGINLKKVRLRCREDILHWENVETLGQFSWSGDRCGMQS